MLVEFVCITMPSLHSLSKGLLVHVLDLSSDASVLELAAASRAVKTEVEECSASASEGPWRHPAGTWKTSGLWKFLGLGDLKKIAARNLAADTIDDHVTSKFSFELAHTLCEPVNGVQFCRSCENVEIFFSGCRIKCFLEVMRFHSEDPQIHLMVSHEELPEHPWVYCNSLQFPELRLRSSSGNIYYDELEATHPLTKLVRERMPLLMFFGICGIDPDAKGWKEDLEGKGCGFEVTLRNPSEVGWSRLRLNISLLQAARLVYTVVFEGLASTSHD